MTSLHTMFYIHNLFTYLALTSLIPTPQFSAQSPPTSSLDTLLQDYAYRALATHPRTGVVFEAQVPPSLSGVGLAALRLRSGSLRRKGVDKYKEFKIPPGLIETPYVLRVVLVYQNLANWSSVYFRVPGHTLVAPVLGLLVYDATHLSAINLPQLNLTASNEPILVEFGGVRSGSLGVRPKCVWFDLHGLAIFTNMTASNVCSTHGQGHFSIVVETSAPSQGPAQGPGLSPGGSRKSSSKAWKIIASVVGGCAFLALLAFTMIWLVMYMQRRRMDEMERQSELSEALQVKLIGNTRAPTATATRTSPTLEVEYVP